MSDPVFRTTGAWGSGVGRNLAPHEIDENFYALLQRIVDLETGGETPVGISNITQAGATFTVWLTDGSHLGPYTLPYATFRWREEWAFDTAYGQLDVFSVSNSGADNGVYLVLEAHTTPAEATDVAFDPAATDETTDANPLYAKIMGSASVNIDLFGYWRSILVDECVIAKQVARIPFYVPAGADSVADSDVAPAVSGTVSLRKNGVQFGTLTISAAGNVSSISIASRTDFNRGDVYEAVAVTPDGTWTGAAITVAAVRII